MKKKIVYVGFSFSHHGEHSGYNQIKNYFPYDKIINCQKSFNILNFIFKRKTILSRIYGHLMGGRIWWVEFALIILSIFNPNKFIFHIIYGENIYKYLGYFKFGNSIVLTLHQPQSYFEAKEQKSYIDKLKRVDKIIVMSLDMEIYFNNKFPDKQVYFIPHGINTEFYLPDIEKEKQCNILMVGNWLRDFIFADRIFNYLLDKFDNLSIHVVTDPKNRLYFTKENERLIFMSNISDEQLRTLYQTTRCMFLPLSSFTANNAILEAAAAGCPIVIATDNINTSYLSKEQICFVPLQYEFVCQYFEQYLNTVSDLEKTKHTQEFIVKNYSWKKIAQRTKHVLLDNSLSDTM